MALDPAPLTWLESLSNNSIDSWERLKNVAELPELFRLKCASHHYSVDMDSTHFKRNNPLACRVSA
jgi:hypothetical protein